MQDYLLLANDCIIYSNDICSFEKEWLENNKKLERMYNVVARTVIIDGCSIENALTKMATEYENLEEKALKAREELNKHNLSPNAKILIELVGYQIGGNFYSGLVTDRYNKLYE